MTAGEAAIGAQQLQRLFSLVSEPLVVLDQHAVVEFVNPAGSRLLGCETGASIDALRERLGDPAVRWIRQAIAGRPPSGELPPARLANGDSVRLSWQPLDSVRSAIHLSAAPPPAASGDDSGWRALRDSALPAALLDTRLRIADVNAAFLRWTGFARDRLVGLDPVDLQPQEDRSIAWAERKQRQAAVDRKLASAPIERRFVDAAGRTRWCRVATSPLAGADGQRFELAIFQETTAEHVARERADRCARELDDWFDSSPTAMVLYDEDGLLVRTNRGFDALVGALPVSLAEAADELRQLLLWDDRAARSALLAEAAPRISECWCRGRDGTHRRLRATIRSYRTSEGPGRFMAVVEDRSIEDERDLAQLQIDALLETAGVGLATFEEAAGWVQRRAATGRAPASAALESIGREVVLPQSLPEYERLQQALRNAERIEVRYAIHHPALGVRWLSTRVEPATLGSGKRATSVVTLDITERQQTQARSEELLREVTTILESSSAGIAYLRGALLVRCNRRFKAMLGLRGGNVEGSSIHELFGHHPRVQELAAATMRALGEGRRYETEVELAGRGDRPAQWIALSVRRSGPTESIAVLSDITRLKAQQRELESLARDHELMFSLSEVGIAFIRGGAIRRANQALQALTGYSASELAAMPPAALFAHRDSFELVSAQQDEALSLHGRWRGEWQLRRKDGRSLWVQVSNRLAVEGDPAAGMIAAYVNVDDRHRAEQLVALQAERTRLILDSVLVGIVTVGVRGIEWMNRSARRMFGGDLVDFFHLPLSTVATPEPEHPFRRTRYSIDLVEGEAETFECRLRARDGREFWVVGNAVATGGAAGGRQLTYALLDIDRRRQAEAQRSHAQASLQRLIEAAPLAITLRDAATLQVLQTNQVAARSAGSTPEQLVGRTPEEIFGPEIAAERRRDMEQALASPGVTQREYRIVRDATTEVWDARYLPLASEPGSPPDQLLLVATNVTEQRRAQQAQLDAAIAQREMLVKEVHHRIKNNLQGVVGLMQQIARRKPEVAGAIAEVVGQVQTIAQVYGLQVGASGPLRVKGVVEAIAHSVQRIFGRAVAFSAEGGDADDWVLPEAESIPIALAFNELLTNAIKHSAADAAVDCKLISDDPGVKLTIANRGRLPDGFDLARYPGGVSGLGLVQALLPRRSASLSLTQQGETALAILLLRPPAVARAGAQRPGAA